jgi:urease accessory protein
MPDCRRPEENAALDGNSRSHARLTLGFADHGGTTRLVERSHFGPLRVQKALYPEGPGVCHAIVVHPPGGVVGGDQLSIAVDAGPAAQAFLTAPGAAKWYRANGRISRQHVRLQAGAGAAIEWMPQESIFFDGAHVELEHSVTLAADASYIGCEIVCLGRRASGEMFNAGSIGQRTQIRRDGRLIWWEQGVMAGDGRLLASPLGLGGHSVCGTLIAVGKTLPAAQLEAARAAMAGASSAEAACGLTQMKGVLVARYLGQDNEAARRAMLAAWRHVRPHLLGREATLPRIWNT